MRKGDRLNEFSIDAVARRADVVRMTVYYQFGARRGLLEALFDEESYRGFMQEASEELQQFRIEGGEVVMPMDAFVVTARKP